MTVHAVVYTNQGVRRYEDLEAATSRDGPIWVHARDVDSEVLTTLRETFDLHSLAIEDVLGNQPRSKTEEYDEYTFVLLKRAERNQRDDIAFAKEIQTTPIGFFIGSDWLVTLSTDELPAAHITRGRLVNGNSRLLRRGPDFVAYRLMDHLVDGYYTLLEEVEDDIEVIEEDVLTETDPEVIQSINTVRRDLLAFRKIAWPAREAIAHLSRGDSDTVSERNERYFRDLYDHLVQVADLAETYRDLIAGSRDIYLNMVSQSTNEVTKVLTVVATIFIPLTFVVGLYGMNFDPTASPYSMPELLWTYGYPATMLGMGAMAAIIVGYFYRRDWI